LVFNGFGYDGVSWSTAANVGVLLATDASWTETSKPTRIQFVTTAAGSTSTAVRMTIKGDGKVGIGTDAPKSLLQVNGSVQVGADTDAASADKIGAIRYRVDGNNTYAEMCMQTGAATYAWIVLATNSW